MDSLRINNMKYLIISILMLFASCGGSTLVSASTPDWVLGKGHESFPSSEYLVGVGVSEKSPIYASESARAELIKTIRVKVNSVATDYNSREKSVSESSIISETDFILEGSQVKDGWYDTSNRLYFSFVVIERELVIKTLKTIIDNIIQNITLMMRQGDSFYNDGDVITALVYYYDGYKEAEKLLPCIQTYNSVIMVNKYKNEYSIVFKEKIQDIVDNIYIEKVSTTVSTSKININVRALFKGVGIKNFPMKFSSGYNRYVERVICDRMGQCEISPLISKVVHMDDNDIRIKAVVDLQTLEKHFNHILNKRLFGRLELVSVSFKASKKINHIVKQQRIPRSNSVQRTSSVDCRDIGVCNRPRVFQNRSSRNNSWFDLNINVNRRW